MLGNLSFKQLFLVDGLGAVVTALLLSQVLARWEPLFGMPKSVLFVLAGIAGCFAVYSLLCHFLVEKNWRPYLRGIAIANTLYCCLTLGLVVYRYEALTWLGIAYFLGEIMLVLFLVTVEVKKSKEKVAMAVL